MKWSKLEPSEFFFYTGPVIDETDSEEYGIVSWTIICPKTFFEENGYVLDQHLGISIHLPEDMGEEQECLFSSSRSIEDTRNDLLARGFQENDTFSYFCSTHDPFCG